MSRVAFIQLCAHFKAKGWLTDSKHILVEEKMAIFLMIIGHNQRYRVVKNRFQHSTQTIHKIFHEVLDKMIEFAKEIIVPTSFNPNPDVPGNNRRLQRIFKVNNNNNNPNTCIRFITRFILTTSVNVGSNWCT